MNFCTLKYFLTVADMLNFTKAAERLHISQQALSSHVRNLEEELGVELYNRGKRISLTYAGIRFAQYATEILRVEQQMLLEMRNIANNERGTLRIAVNPTRSAALLPEILPKFYEEYPYVEIVVSEATPQHVDDLLMSGETDISIGLRPWYSRVEMEKLCPEMLVMLIPKAIFNRIFGCQADAMREKLSKEFDPKPFEKIPMIMLAKGMQIRAWVDEYFEENNIHPNILYESSGVQTMLSLAVRGLGVTYCTETFLYSIWQELQKPSFIMIRLPPRSTRGRYPLGVFYRDDRSLNEVTKRFAQLVGEFYRNGQFVYEDGEVRLTRSTLGR